MQRDLPLLKKAGLGLAAISYDSQGALLDFATRKHIEFPLLSDHESETIRAYGVMNREYRKGMGLDIDQERVMLTTLVPRPPEDDSLKIVNCALLRHSANFVASISTRKQH